MNNSVIETSGGFDFRSARAAERENLRRALLDAAGRLLSAEGPEALSIRRVAREVNASTQVLYTLFGGKDGLSEALFLEGFERLAAANAAAVEGVEDPVARLEARSHSYFDNAVANPHYYRVMFAGAIPGYRPSREALDRSWPQFLSLEQVVADCARQGRFRPEIATEPREPALAFWAAWHGAASLLLSDHLAEPDQARAVLDRGTDALIAAFGPT